MPTPETDTEKEPLVLVVGGAFTLHAKLLSPVYRWVYRGVLGVSGRSEAIFPDRGGAASWQTLTDNFTKVADHKIYKYSAEEVLFVGHSMGAALALRYCAERPDLSSAVVCIAGALGGVALPNLIKPINRAFMKNTEECYALLESSPIPVHQIATDRDEVLGVDSTLAELPGSTRTLLAEHYNSDLDPAINQVLARVPILAHLNIVSRPETISVVTSEFDSMRQAA